MLGYQRPYLKQVHALANLNWTQPGINEKEFSALQCSEGAGLKPMAEGLVKRYTDAGVSPPKLLYVDRDCCEGGAVKMKDLFKQCGDLFIRVDIWHFMRWIAVGCTTEAHPLYGVFLGWLSQCIFQ